MKKRYESPLLEVIALNIESSILDNSIFVTLALIDDVADTDTRDMTIVDAENW